MSEELHVALLQSLGSMNPARSLSVKVDLREGSSSRQREPAEKGRLQALTFGRCSEEDEVDRVHPLSPPR